MDNTKQLAKHHSWCLEKGLQLYPRVVGNSYEIMVNVRKRGRWTEKPTDGMLYPKNPTKKEPKWWDKIQELYKMYYEKYNK